MLNTRPAILQGRIAQRGAIAQLGEHLTGSQKVVGSSPIGSTEYGAGFQGREARRFLLQLTYG